MSTIRATWGDGRKALFDGTEWLTSDPELGRDLNIRYGIPWMQEILQGIGYTPTPETVVAEAFEAATGAETEHQTTPFHKGRVY